MDYKPIDYHFIVFEIGSALQPLTIIQNPNQKGDTKKYLKKF
jgi:hypothetical protein